MRGGPSSDGTVDVDQALLLDAHEHGVDGAFDEVGEAVLP